MWDWLQKIQNGRLAAILSFLHFGQYLRNRFTKSLQIFTQYLLLCKKNDVWDWLQNNSKWPTSGHLKFFTFWPISLQPFDHITSNFHLILLKYKRLSVTRLVTKNQNSCLVAILNFVHVEFYISETISGNDFIFLQNISYHYQTNTEKLVKLYTKCPSVGHVKLWQLVLDDTFFYYFFSNLVIIPINW